MTEGQLDLLVVGDLNVDIVVRGDDVVPRFGQREQLVERADLLLGGSGGIAAHGAARLGLSTGLCATVGDDDIGRLMVERAAGAGVDVSRVRVDPTRPTGATVILERADGRAILTAVGAISALSEDDLTGVPDRPARHVHLASLFLLSDGLRAALPDTVRRWSAAGATTSLDTNWDPEEAWDTRGLLDLVDLVLPNEAELAALTRTGSTEEALVSWAYPGAVAVKRGAHGGSVLARGALHHVEATDGPEPIDTTGAGDSFDAGYLAGMLRGLDPPGSLALAVACGSLSVSGVGGTAAQSSLEQARALARKLPQS